MKKEDKRLNKILEILSKHLQKDFSHSSPVSAEGDELDAISVGLNKMVEEVQTYIAERKKYEEQLKKSNELFSNLFENNPASLAISRISDARMININESFLHLFGFSSKEEVLGKTVAELNIWVETKQRDEMMRLLKENNKVLNLEGQIRTPKGDIKWASSSVIIIEVDKQPCLLAVTLDITERKNAEAQLEAVNKELEAFTYSVSHDLRAPLRAVNGYAEMLNEDYNSVMDENGKRIIENVKYNAKKMGTLIDELLAFSRLGRKEIQKTTIDMNELAEGVMIEMNKSVPHSAKIKISKLHTIKADYGLLHQALFNLVSNAVKYSSKKEDPLVEIFSEEKNDSIVFSVKDNGAGFDMRYADKLFGVFQRLHSQEEFEGIGVGLAIVQRVISKHGGKVWAQGKMNEGATFYFSLTKN